MGIYFFDSIWYTLSEEVRGLEFIEVKNFFTDNYDHPIIECGVQLSDMIYLRRKTQ